MRKTCPIWARLSVRILVGFLAVPQESAFPEDALFLAFCNLCFAWMPFKMGASRLQLPKACYRLCNYKRECPLIRGTLSLGFVAE